MLAEIAKEMPWSLNQPQNQKPTNPKVSKTTIKQQISKLNERLEKLGLPGDGKNLKIPKSRVTFPEMTHPLLLEYAAYYMQNNHFGFYG